MYLERYRNPRVLGEWVWQEMMSEGPLPEGSELWNDAYSVARETMARARQNIEAIVDQLSRIQYRFAGFGSGLANEAWLPPTPDTPKQVARLAAEAGPLPLSLRAWWEVVGGVSLQGSFDQAGREQVLTDPLVVYPVDRVLEQMEEQREDSELSEEERLTVALAPDLYHKGDVSGGAPYEVRLPDGRVDTPLRNVRILLSRPDRGTGRFREVETTETFVEYLRRSLEWAGFPGIAFMGLDPQVERNLQPLSGQMNPI